MNFVRLVYRPILFFIFTFLLGLIYLPLYFQVLALESCSGLTIDISAPSEHVFPKDKISFFDVQVTITNPNMAGIYDDREYSIDIDGELDSKDIVLGKNIKAGGTYTFKVEVPADYLKNQNTKNINFFENHKRMCKDGQITFIPEDIAPVLCNNVYIDNFNGNPRDVAIANKDFSINVEGITRNADVKIDVRGGPGFSNRITDENGNTSWLVPASSSDAGRYFAVITDKKDNILCQFSLTICDPTDTQCISIDPEEIKQQNDATAAPFDLCAQTRSPDSAAYQNCMKCMGAGQTKNIWTGLGCIRTDTKGLIEDLMTILFGLAGGIALLLMLYGAFTYTTASGDPKKAGQAKEVFGGAVTGLLLIIFSIIILQFVGVTILKLPGF